MTDRYRRRLGVLLVDDCVSTEVAPVSEVEASRFGIAIDEVTDFICPRPPGAWSDPGDVQVLLCPTPVRWFMISRCTLIGDLPSEGRIAVPSSVVLFNAGVHQVPMSEGFHAGCRRFGDRPVSTRPPPSSGWRNRRRRRRALSCWSSSLILARIGSVGDELKTSTPFRRSLCCSDARVDDPQGPRSRRCTGEAASNEEVVCSRRCRRASVSRSANSIRSISLKRRTSGAGRLMAPELFAPREGMVHVLMANPFGSSRSPRPSKTCSEPTGGVPRHVESRSSSSSRVV